MTLKIDEEKDVVGAIMFKQEEDGNVRMEIVTMPNASDWVVAMIERVTKHVTGDKDEMDQFAKKNPIPVKEDTH